MSAPSGQNRCFRPETAFQRPDGTYVRAASLGIGMKLLSPGTYASVGKVTKYKPNPKPLHFVTLRTSASKFCATSDHRILVQDLEGGPVPVELGGLLCFDEHVELPLVYNGAEFLPILDIKESFEEKVAVVEVSFESDDAAVLAWHLPKHKPRSICGGAAIACLGQNRNSADSLDLAGFVATNTFIDEHHRPPSSSRSRSVPLPGVCGLVGVWVPFGMMMVPPGSAKFVISIIGFCMIAKAYPLEELRAHMGPLAAFAMWLTRSWTGCVNPFQWQVMPR